MAWVFLGVLYAMFAGMILADMHGWTKTSSVLELLLNLLFWP